MTAPYDTFLDTLDCLPAELERNFTLIQKLDQRSSGLMKKINDCVKRYENCRTDEERLKIRRDTHKLFDTLVSFADDKLDISDQLYDAIDKTIKKLLKLVVLPDANGTKIPGGEKVGLNMPEVPNEPVFCYCRSISFGEMVACDDKSCPIEWFHLGCVNLEVAPKENEPWYCRDCSLKLDPRKKPKV